MRHDISPELWKEIHEYVMGLFWWEEEIKAKLMAERKSIVEDPLWLEIDTLRIMLIHGISNG